MTDHAWTVADLARDLVRIDSRSAISNLPVAERLEAELGGFDIERLDYADADGTPKRVLVAHRGQGAGLALSGHMDTVPDTGWQDDPWSGRIEDGALHGLGSVDMKGQVAALVVAARALPESVPVTLLLTTDEETTKEGARRIARESALVRQARPRAILVAEPTELAPVRGHRAHVAFTAVATGVQAHSASGKGRNANWDLLPFLAELRWIWQRLQTDTSLQDAAYDPAVSDFNLVIDNHGAAVNVTVPKATARVKFRYSAKVDPAPIIQAVRDAAARAGLTLREDREGSPPELPAEHPFVRLCTEVTGTPPRTAPYGTDASELQAIAPCVVLGPGSIAAAHTPGERVRIDDLAAAVPLFMQLLERVATA